jgi:hypothetical protein
VFRFIGGPARCGKTTLTHQTESLYTGQQVSLDNLRHAFIPLAAEAILASLEPDAELTETTTTDEWIDILRDRDRTVWTGAKAYLAAATDNNDDVLMEGCLWPDYIAELEVPFRAVFLVDTSPNHADRLIAVARSESTHNNWMREHNDAWMRRWAKYNIARSERYKQLGDEYNQPVFDIADSGIAQAQAAALEYLFPDSVS